LEFSEVSLYNTHAGQEIRKPVVTRKISQQNRSSQGSEAHVIFMYFSRSTELQGLNPIDKLQADAKILLAELEQTRAPPNWLHDR
jgi:hypothetical protein